MVMTVHRWFAAKACPGDYLYNLHDEIAAEVNRRLSGGVVAPPSVDGTPVNYKATVTASVGLNCRTNPSTTSNIITAYPFGTVLTITKESAGWGYTGTGWVSLQYTKRITEDEVNGKDEEDMDLNGFKDLMNQFRAELRDNDASNYSAEARQWSVDNGLIAGSSDAEFNGMWEDFLTREQLVTVLYRFAQMMGKA